MTSNLFKPLQVGACRVANRVALAPLTRMRNNEDFSPNELVAEYYTQRASSPGTLLITEACFISERAGGYYGAPGIWSDSQIAGWKKVTAGVHSKSSFLFMQLWALGREAINNYPNYIEDHPDKFDHVGASAIKDKNITKPSIPRPLTEKEIGEYVKDYATVAKNALAAGCDGVEIHSANGYLLDQFIHTCSNVRDDKYGGSIENRARFTLEVVDAVIEAVGSKQVGIRFSPWETFQDMVPERSMDVWEYILDELEKRAASGKQLAYVHVVEPGAAGVLNTLTDFSILKKASKGGDATRTAADITNWMRKHWSGVWIRAGGYNRDTALEDISKDDKSMIAFGRFFISNPDIVNRLEKNVPLTPCSPEHFYVGGPTGYTDYTTAK